MPPGIKLLLEPAGCGVTLDDDVGARKECTAEGGRDSFLVKQVATAWHLPSFSALETE